MDLFFKAVALVLLTAVLTIFLKKLETDIAVILSIVACCMVCVTAFHYLEPVFSLLSELTSMSHLQSDILQVMMKVIGIAFLSEIVSSICTDSGNGSMAKMLQFLSSGVILYLSVPIFQILLNLLKDIMGEL